MLGDESFSILLWSIIMVKIEFPTHFVIKYPKRNIKYYSSYGKRKIAPLLEESCKFFCMYCGKTLQVDNDRRYHIEHSVDKDGNIYQAYDKFEVLKHCKYNLAIACSECNMVCKKAVDKLNFAMYEPFTQCPKECSIPCSHYLELRNDYMKKNALILQPLGIRSPVAYEIDYNLLKLLFVPSVNGDNEEIRFFIQNHIDRFELNGRRYTSNVIDICTKIVTWYVNGTVTYEKLMDNLSTEEPSNVIGALFKDYLRNTYIGQPVQNMIDFCKLLIVLDALP